MDGLDTELMRLRDRVHELATDVMTNHLQIAETRGQVRELMKTVEKYVPVIERLDDQRLEQAAVAKEAGKESARHAAYLVAAVAVVGTLFQILSGVFHF